MRRLLALAALLACATPSDAARAQVFRPELFFAGTTRASGVLTDPSGRVTGRFTGTTLGRRDRDGSVTFDQTIRFDDGTIRQRRWRIVRTGPDSIEATGTDLVGTARGTVSGPTLHLVSTVRWQDGSPITDVDFDQVMTLQPDGQRVSNHSTVTKLGLVLRYADETFVRTGAVR